MILRVLPVIVIVLIVIVKALTVLAVYTQREIFSENIQSCT